MSKGESMYTGPLAEAELLGEITNPKELARREKELERRIGWLSQWQLRETVKDFQPGDPSDPGSRFAGDLFTTIAEKLCPEDYSKLRYFTAVTSERDISLRSRLDVYKGVDAFFEYDSDRGKIEVVTLDVSLLPKGKYKSDIFILIPPESLDPKEDKEEWEYIIGDKSREIIRSFNAKMENKGVRYETR